MTTTGSTNLDATASFRAYDQAWGIADDVERGALLRTAVPDDVVWKDPFNDLRGVQALSDFLGGFIRGGQRLVTIGGWQQHHDYGRFRWVALNDAGDVFAEGEDIATVDRQGKLERFLIFAQLADKQ